MLESLKFVSRALAHNDHIPEFHHFAIRGGRVTASDGTMTASAPLNLSFDAAPLGIPMVKALDACADVISLVREKSILTVRSGSFSATIPCVDVKTIPVVQPEGIGFLPVDIVLAFKALRPFISSDPSRPAVNSILLTGESAYSTNNICIAQYWLGTPFPYSLNVPVAFVDEVIRHKEEPKTCQMTESSLTLHYSDGKWLKTQLIALEWPHAAGVLNKAWEGAVLAPISPQLKEACQTLATFGAVTTSFKGDKVTGDLASVDVECPKEGSFYTKFLKDVLGVAKEADWSKNPVPWNGENNLRGVLCGVRE